MSDRSDEVTTCNPTLYHMPHLCVSSGGAVSRYSQWFQYKREWLECQDCGCEVEPDETLTQEQMELLDVLMGQSVLALIGTDRLTAEHIQAAYETDLAQVRQLARAGR